MNRFFLPIGSVLILLLNLFLLHSPVVGFGLFIAYLFLLMRHVSLVTRLPIAGPLVILSSLILANAVIYYIYGTTAVTSALVLTLSLLFFIPKESTSTLHTLQSTLKKIIAWRNDMVSPFRQTRDVFLAVSVACLDSILLGYLWLHRTTDLMPSPWQAVDWRFFAVFTIATLLLVYTVLTSKLKHVALVLISLHMFVLYAIAVLLYPLGYGFDAFIHRATESWIFEHGFINPKEPYYIGQYSLVTFLAHITGMSIFFLDVYLIPLLSALSLPFVLGYAYSKTWGMKHNHAIVHVLAIALIPFLSFHLTTPHNLVILLSILTIFATLLYQQNKCPWYIPLLLTLSALITHPLIGAPLFGFVLTAGILQHTKTDAGKRLWLTLSLVGQTLLLPAMFTFNNLRTGNGWPLFSNPILEIPAFFELFSWPYWYLDRAPLFWEIVYTWERLIVPLAILVALVGFGLYKKKTLNSYIYPCSAVGLFLSAWLLRSWITFPNVVIYEQGDYPLRLIHASFLFLLPWFLYGMYLVAKKLQIETNSFRRPFLVLIGACLLTMSFYFSYPQRNIKSRFPGFNITASDFHTVQWIHAREGYKTGDDIDYIVLSNQLTSVASLTEYSFAKSYTTALGPLFYYSIPTGGPLYAQYGKMLYQGQKREYMESAMDLTGVNKAYFVVSKYWANADKIIEEAKKTADSWESIDDGSVVVFVYERK
jgi:hypothetical protein